MHVCRCVLADRLANLVKDLIRDLIWIRILGYSVVNLQVCKRYPSDVMVSYVGLFHVDERIFHSDSKNPIK